MIDGELIKNMVREIIPRELSAVGRWELVIADEDKKLSKGSFSILKIKKISVPPNSIVVLMNVLRHSNAELVDLLISDEGGEIDGAVVYSEYSRLIKSGEILGVVKISDTSPKEKHKVLEVFRELKKRLDSIENGIGDSFIKHQWPVI